MKTIFPRVVFAAWIVVAAAAHADLYITNFTGVNAPIGASGVWRNATTATDVPSTSVSLSQIGGAVESVGGGSQASVIDDSFPWVDIPAFPPIVPTPIDAFNPNYDGDFINVEVRGRDTSIVFINFNTLVANPVLNFTDVDVQTTMVFNKPFTVVGGTSNLSATGNTVRTTGANVGAPFDVECAGSLRFNGFHSHLIVGIYNSGPDPDRDDDRTGFSVSTESQPVPLQLLVPALAIFATRDHIMLTWSMGTLSGIRHSNTLGGTWTPTANDLEETDYWVGEKNAFGPSAFFRGVAPPPPP